MVRGGPGRRDGLGSAVFSCLRPLAPRLTWVVWTTSWETSLFLSQGSHGLCYRHWGGGGSRLSQLCPLWAPLTGLMLPRDTLLQVLHMPSQPRARSLPEAEPQAAAATRALWAEVQGR